MHTSYIELSKSAMRNNVSYVRSRLPEGTTLSAVCKGNAYGHGIEQVVEMAEAAGIRHFSVFSSSEARRVQQSIRHKSTIMIIGYIANEELSWAIENNIEFYVFEMDRLLAAIETAKAAGKKAIIHIEVETGMNRTGFEENVLPLLFDLLRENKEYLQLQGLCTHFAGAESVANYLRVEQQIAKYHVLYDRFCNEGLQPKLRHTACSAAAINFPETTFDMVRVGIMLYGFWPNEETYIYQLRQQEHKGKDPLKRLIRWKSHIMNTKKVKMGEFIGYGTSYQAPRDMHIATIPVGYAYGFARSLSNLGRVLVRGRRMHVIGVVNMNLAIIDINELPDIQKGEEVVMVGKQGRQEVTVASFSEMSSQLNYELLTRLPLDIPRKIVK
ncbi:alanine racemase [Nafulsella turpanensis]|uniref:alanine racemase n=1 Tax=Nafulsella turpanensis TaxID=1265690 RepID=UPI00034D9540|nr:alanine racemase [Nafulsella turpanensis]